MSLNALEAQLREMTQCKICFEDKDNQKQLPCQHTLCLDCLTKLKLDNSKYKCPLCNKANLVPNGGFESLPDSLITKQLASLLHSRDWETAAATQEQDGAKAGTQRTETKPNTESSKKLRVGAQRGKKSIELAKQKIDDCTVQREEVKEACKAMRYKLTELKETKIAEIEKTAQEKLDAVEKVTKVRLAELSTKETKFAATRATMQELAEGLDSQAEELDKGATDRDVTSDLHSASERLRQLEEVFSHTEVTPLKAGDSVRLKMETKYFSEKFFERKFTHADVGYILEMMNDQGRCAVLFPNDTRFVGEIDWLEKSSVRHTLPVIGDRVRVKRTLEKPFYEWGRVKPESVGVLREMMNHGPDAGREVVVDFPEHSGWKSILNDLEVVPAEPLRVGEEVWVRLEVSEPAGGWAGVTHTSKGTLLSVNCDDVLVNFSECKEWRGLVTELERVRPISAGDKVRVAKSVSEPKTGWAGVSHKDEGIVKTINDHEEYDKVALIDFPNRASLWKCITSELELVERKVQTGSTVRGGTERREIGIPAELAAHMSQRVTEQVVGRHAEQCAQQ